MKGLKNKSEAWQTTNQKLENSQELNKQMLKLEEKDTEAVNKLFDLSKASFRFMGCRALIRNKAKLLQKLETKRQFRERTKKKGLKKKRRI